MNIEQEIREMKRALAGMQQRSPMVELADKLIRLNQLRAATAPYQATY